MMSTTGLPTISCLFPSFFSATTDSTWQTRYASLHHPIDQFIEVHREQLSHQDIVLTASGATRCKTNMHFALDNLRQLGLILSINEKKHRTWIPSVLGILVVLLVIMLITRIILSP